MRMTNRARADFSGARKRIERAALHRREMGGIRQDENQRSLFRVTREARKSAVVLTAFYDAPDELAIIFGEWLFNMRAALDYCFFQLAVEDTGRNPPTRPGARMFPLRGTRAEFDAELTRDTFHGMSPSTIKMVEAMQPYHTKYGADGNALRWLHDLARRDRHREPNTMGARIMGFEATAHETPGVTILGADKFDPERVPAVVGPGESLWIASVHCGSQREARLLEDRVELHIENTLETVEWYRETFKTGASQNIRNDSLESRMTFVEHFMGVAIDQFETALGNA